jgi:4-amino-4-deoxy-L-arabinose transferase-like glycosyltransferase
MTLTATPEPAKVSRGPRTSLAAPVPALLGALWLVLFFASLFSPPVLDDADGTHANAARQIALSGDWVTLRVNQVRYLEKAPLPYWIVAASLRIFGCNTFAAHLPQALAVLLLTLLGHRWAREAFGDRAALYTGLGVLTSAGVFLFTRVFIPDILLSLLLALALYCFLHSLDYPSNPGAPFIAPLSHAMSGHSREGANRLPPHLPHSSSHSALYPCAMWTALALAVLTKGLVAIIFLFGTAAIYLALTGEYRQWRRLKPFTGALILLTIAAPWHILAGLRNPAPSGGHGFFWFYFVNEHVLRFLGRRIPTDYNKLPGYLYWGLHLVWLFPWALFAPLMLKGWRTEVAGLRNQLNEFGPRPLFRYLALFVPMVVVAYVSGYGVGRVRTKQRTLDSAPEGTQANRFSRRTILLLAVFIAFVLLFFSVSTNQEYYTFPTYLPLLMLIAAALASAELTPHDSQLTTALTFAHAAFTVIGLAVAAALAYGLWTSRSLAFVPDIGDLLAHRGVGDYTLSMSSLFDLTGPSFAALRLPASLALAAFAIGPAVAWKLRAQRRHLAATSAVALTSAVFLIAAHLALVRFAPMLSSQDMAAKILSLEASGRISRDNTLLLFGDQAYGSSIPFYLNRPLDRPALLVHGRSSSMLFGSTFPDAQPLFLTPSDLLARWGAGERKLLFVPLERRADVDRLLGPHQFLLQETSGKALLTDRPLDP